MWTSNPEAVEICRLRLWLSMVLDMDEPPAPNSDWALPNLDFQIVTGDSLVDRVAGGHPSRSHGHRLATCN